MSASPNPSDPPRGAPPRALTRLPLVGPLFASLRQEDPADNPFALAALTGCASAPAPKAPQQTAKADVVEESPVVLPSYLTAAPGTMDVSWEAPEPPPEKKVRAKKAIKPYEQAKKRRLFVLPTTFSAGN